MFEMCRVHQLKGRDLGKIAFLEHLGVVLRSSRFRLLLTMVDMVDMLLELVDKPFLDYLLDLVERTRTDDAEDLNNGTIKLLLVFNEQFMLSMSHRTKCSQEHVKLAPGGNPLLSVLSDRHGTSCTFGESLIFMLNRAGMFLC